MSIKAKHNNLPLIIGCIFALIGIAVIFASGSPYDLLHKISIYRVIPPLWMWCLSTVIFDFLTGFALGLICSDIFSNGACREREISAYQGCIFFAVSFLLFLAHYPMLFVAERLVLALLIAIISLVCAGICFVFWAKISPIPTIIIVAYMLWLAYLTFANGYIILNI